jgi:HK97 family phage prohead protease
MTLYDRMNATIDRVLDDAVRGLARQARQPAKVQAPRRRRRRHRHLREWVARSVSSERPGRLVGWACVWNSPGKDKNGGRVIIRRGAFRDVLASGENVLAVINHSPRRVLGSLHDGSLKLREDCYGLHAEIALRPTHFGCLIGPAVKCGLVTKMSFLSADEEFHYDHEGTRVITRFGRLADVSVVRKAAFRATSVMLFPHYGGFRR